MIVPVPVVLQKENVKTLPREVFAKLEQLDAPRLVEYWDQDPGAGADLDNEHAVAKAAAAPMGGMGTGGGGNLGVKIEAQFTVGEYEIVILSAESSSGLDTWLRQEKYNIPAGAEPYLRPYVAEGSRFFVAKVDPTKVKFENGQAALSPLRFHYDSEQFKLPVRLGLINSGGKQDLIVHILARGKRYEVANYPNVTIPTNLDVEDNTKGEFGTFYAGLFDQTVTKNPGAVVTEYSWDASTYDPCPGPALYAQDFATLGDDVMPHAAETPQRYYFGGGYTLTRLHTRYDKQTLGADLVFRSAPAIVGGREFYAQGGAHRARCGRRELQQLPGALRHPSQVGRPHRLREPETGRLGWSARRSRVRADEVGDEPGVRQARWLSALVVCHRRRPRARVRQERCADAISARGELERCARDHAYGGGCAGCATAEDTSPAAAAVLMPLVVFALRRRRKPAS